MNFFMKPQGPSGQKPVFTLNQSCYDKAQGDAISIARKSISTHHLQNFVNISKHSENLVQLTFHVPQYAKSNAIDAKSDYDKAMTAVNSAMRPVIDDLKNSGYTIDGDGGYNEDYVYWVKTISAEKYAMFNETANSVGSVNCAKILTECAIPFQSSAIAFLSEEAKLQVTDEVLTGMLRFITDKYNAIDFSEIEKSAGDISKFPYTKILLENCETLTNIYTASPDPGAKEYIKVTAAVQQVISHLQRNRVRYSELYKGGNGIVQLLYTSMVAACIYSVGILVSNTIRFVTTEQETECQVLYDEIPGTLKHVHIKNILAAANDLDTIEKLLESYDSPKGKAVQESVTGFAVGALAVGIGIMLIPKILVLIREIIYSVYFNRVRVSEMLTVQIDLINTNIESLEHGRGSKKVIARQKKIVDKLTKWKNRIAIKMDTTTTAVAVQKQKENRALKVDNNSPIVRSPGSFDAGSIML